MQPSAISTLSSGVSVFIASTPFKALSRYPRDSYTLATKLMVPPEGVNEEDAKREIYTSPFLLHDFAF